MKEIIINCETGNKETRDLTPEEISAVENFDKKNETRWAQRQALLDKLGITQEEAALLLS